MAAEITGYGLIANSETYRSAIERGKKTIELPFDKVVLTLSNGDVIVKYYKDKNPNHFAEEFYFSVGDKLLNVIFAGDGIVEVEV